MSAAFPGILVYLILWLLMPKRDYRLDAPPQNYQQPVRTVYDEHKVKR